MSRIGKQAVEIPSGVTCSVDGQSIAVKGPKGNLELAFTTNVTVSVEDNEVRVAKANGSRQATADWGTTRSHIDNMVKGVTDGWKKELEINGVGYTATASGSNLKLVVGYSHDVDLQIPQGVDCKIDRNIVSIEGADKGVVGQFAATIRKSKPAEPYLGVGIKYVGEQIRRKAGKAGKK